MGSITEIKEIREGNDVELLLVGEEGKKKIYFSELSQIAEEEGMDIILLNNNSEIPVVKLGDLAKEEYLKKKKQKDNLKKQKSSLQKFKEVCIGPETAEHDLKIKAKQISKFLDKGAKVKISVNYKGRQLNYINTGFDKLEEIQKYITSEYKVDKPAKIEGKAVTIVIDSVK